MVSLDQQGTAEILRRLRDVAPSNGAWSHADKERLLYPLTQALLGCPLAQRRAVLRQLCGDNGQGHYPAITFHSTDGRPVPIFLPPDTFDPIDPWSWLFRAGLASLDMRGKTICEVGTGSGAAAIELLQSDALPERLVLIDIDAHVLDVARLNIETTCQPRIFDRGIGVTYTVGDAADVFQQMAAAGARLHFDHIFGCIPQVPADPQCLPAGQHVAHEYDERRHQRFHDWGLGLLYDVHRAALPLLSSNGSMVFVHSGRVPAAVRGEFHRQLGLSVVNTLVDQMIPHCPSTSLRYLFGHDQEELLFADIDGTRPISSELAEELRSQAYADDPHCIDCGVYHRVFVLETARNN